MARLGCRYDSDSADRELAKELGHLDYLSGPLADAGSPQPCTERLKTAIDPTACGAICGPLLGASTW